MSFPTLTVYGNSENYQYLRLFSDNEVTDITTLTRVVLELDSTEEIDSEVHRQVFNWRGRTKGVLSLCLGKLWWRTKVYYAKLIVFDDAFRQGIYWGTIRIRAIENTEGRIYL